MRLKYFIFFLSLFLFLFPPGLQQAPLFLKNAFAKEKPQKAGFIQKIRYHRKKDFMRVVLDLQHELPYTTKLQKTQNLLILHFPRAKVSGKIPFQRLEEINDDTVGKISYKMLPGHQREILFFLKEYKKYKIYELHSPPRLVIDIYPLPEKEKKALKEKRITAKKIAVRKKKPVKKEKVSHGTKPAVPSSLRIPPSSIEGIIAESTPPPAPKPHNVKKKKRVQPEASGSSVNIPKGLKDRSELTIVIDPGHGGKDSGATGYHLKEKNVVLDIGKRLRNILKRKYHCKVVMTRDRDIFIPLKERTEIAERHHATLFISIHANASKRRIAKGIETYFLSPARSEGAIETQMRENAVMHGEDPADVGDLELILASMKNTQKINESSQLASFIQKEIIRNTRRHFGKTKDLGVKTAMFVVLFHASMPAVLIETSFISNPKGARRLRSRSFRQSVANSIYLGIEQYLKKTAKEYNISTSSPAVQTARLKASL